MKKAAVEGLERRVLLSGGGVHFVHDVARLSEAREGFVVATVGDQVVFAGGTTPSRAVDVYDAGTGRWGVARLSRAGRPAVAVAGTTAVFALGRWADTYDSETGRWSRHRLTHAVDDRTGVTVVGTRAFFAGGNSVAGASRAVDVFDAADGTWTTATLSAARWDVTAVTVGTRAIFAGGQVGDGEGDEYDPSAAVDVFDAATGRWSTAALPEPGAPQAVIAARRVVFDRGEQLDVFDPASGAFSTTRIPHHFSSSLVAIGGAKVSLAGAFAISGRDYADIYDVATGRWESHKLAEGRYGVDTVRVGDRVLFADGDTDDGFGPTNVVDVYDAATGTWAPPAHTSAVRQGMTSVTLGAQALFAGGYNIGGESVDVVDVYDDDTRQWSTAGRLAHPRFFMYGVGVGGQALFVGGIENGATSTSDVVEIYRPAGPASPVAPSPAPGAALVAAPAALSWAGSAGATGYDVYLDDQLVASVTSSHWTVDRPIAAGAHAWQVVVVRGDGRAGGPLWRFTVGAPGAPSNPNLPDGQAFAGASPELLAWNAARGATSYDVYVDGVLLKTVAQNQFKLESPLAGGAHAWQVVALNGVGTTAGPTWHFSTPVSGITSVRSTTRPTAPANVESVAVAQRVVFAGGLGFGNEPSAAADVYDVRTGRWTSYELSQPRDRVAVTAAWHWALVAGGVPSRHDVSSYSARVDLYNADARRWSTAALSQARTDITGASVGDVALFAGGTRARRNGKPLPINSDVVDLYDTRLDLWSAAKLSQARFGMNVAVVGGKAVFAGGEAYVHGDYTPVASDAVDIYDAETGRWSSAKLSEARADIAVTTVGNLAIFAGGYTWVGSGRTESSDVVDIYDASTGRWSTSHLPRARSGMVATSAGGLALFAGGNSSTVDERGEGAVYIFDPAADEWSTARLSRPHDQSLAAGTVGTKAVFSNSRETFDVFDATTGQWSVAATSTGGGMPVATFGRRVVFAGGGDDGKGVEVFTTN